MSCRRLSFTLKRCICRVQRCCEQKACFPRAVAADQRKGFISAFIFYINLGGKGLCLLRSGCFPVSVLHHNAAGLLWVGSIDRAWCKGNWHGSSQPRYCNSPILIWMLAVESLQFLCVMSGGLNFLEKLPL